MATCLFHVSDTGREYSFCTSDLLSRILAAVTPARHAGRVTAALRSAAEPLADAPRTAAPSGPLRISGGRRGHSARASRGRSAAFRVPTPDCATLPGSISSPLSWSAMTPGNAPTSGRDDGKSVHHRFDDDQRKRFVAVVGRQDEQVGVGEQASLGLAIDRPEQRDLVLSPSACTRVAKSSLRNRRTPCAGELRLEAHALRRPPSPGPQAERAGPSPLSMLLRNRTRGGRRSAAACLRVCARVPAQAVSATPLGTTKMRSFGSKPGDVVAQRAAQCDDERRGRTRSDRGAGAMAPSRSMRRRRGHADGRHSGRQPAGSSRSSARSRKNAQPAGDSVK